MPQRRGRGIAGEGWLLADLSADRVLLLVQGALLQSRDVAAILAGHVALLLADLAIVLVQAGRLGSTQLPSPSLLTNSVIPVGESVVQLFTPEISVLPWGIGGRRPDQARAGDGEAGVHAGDRRLAFQGRGAVGRDDLFDDASLLKQIGTEVEIPPPAGPMEPAAFARDDAPLLGHGRAFGSTRVRSYNNRGAASLPFNVKDLHATGSLFSDQAQRWSLLHKLAQLPKAVVARVEVGQQLQ